MRDLLHLERLKEGKALLAFSGGVDSTALFHLLLEHAIDFDIVHVNYHTRPSSDDEERDAMALARSHGKICHTHSCRLEGGNFEHRAREERYQIFKYLMDKHGYSYLLTAHQLNDRLEWLMMQLCRGSGLPELLGIRSIDYRHGITILRPLLEWDRESIENYLHNRAIPYHIDESNADESYTRNRFRNRYGLPLMRDYTDAIRRSFRYLEEDRDSLIQPVTFDRAEDLWFAPIPTTSRSLVSGVDAQLKSLGYVMKSSEKERLKSLKVSVMGRKYVVSVEQKYIFIAPYQSGIIMDKGFKEECRRLGVEPKLRGYLYGSRSAWETIRRLKDARGPLRSG